MRVGKDVATSKRAGFFGLGFAVCSCSLAAAALGQEPSNRKTPAVNEQPAQEKKTAPATPAVKTKKPPPTFTKDVAAILQQKCQNCHRRHQVGPFALETYEQAQEACS